MPRLFIGSQGSGAQILTNAFKTFDGSYMLVACSFTKSLKFGGETKLDEGLYSVPNTKDNRAAFYELYEADEDNSVKLLATFN